MPSSTCSRRPLCLRHPSPLDSSQNDLLREAFPELFLLNRLRTLHKLSELSALSLLVIAANKQTSELEWGFYLT